MEQRTSYIATGIFLLATAALTVAFTIWVAGGRASDTLDDYLIVFDRDVSGLTLGSPVRYLGVDVGQVVSIGLTDEQGTKVAVQVSVAPDTPVHRGTYASLAYQGITGVAFINFAADPGQFDELTGNLPRVPVRDTGVAALLAQSDDITSQLTLLLEQATTLLGDENQQSLSRTLGNLESLTGTLAQQNDTIAGLPSRLANSLDELSEVAKAAAVLIDKTQPDLVATVAQLNQTTSTMAQLAARLDRMIGNNERELEAFASGGLGELPGLVAETRAAIRELDKLLADLRSDPSQLIYKPRTNAVRVDP